MSTSHIDSSLCGGLKDCDFEGKVFQGSLPTLKSLPQKDALLVLSIKKSLLLCGVKQGDGILLGVSGGADSMALLCALFLLSEDLGLKLSVITCNHQLREASARETAYVSRFCSWLGIPCKIASLDVRQVAASKGQGLEEAGRNLRYQMFERERVRCGAEWIAVAHHARDLAEDVLMRLMRGSGWPGLGGMRMVDEKRHLCRPLLQISPEALRSLLSSLRLPHCEDESNLDATYLRNRVRHELLPRLKQENPRLEESMLRLSELAAMDDAFFDSCLDGALAQTPWNKEVIDGKNSLTLPKRLLAPLPPSLRLRLFLRAVREITKESGGQARASTLLALEKAFEQGGRPRIFQLPKCNAVIAKGTVRFEGNDLLDARKQEDRNAT